MVVKIGGKRNKKKRNASSVAFMLSLMPYYQHAAHHHHHHLYVKTNTAGFVLAPHRDEHFLVSSRLIFFLRFFSMGAHIAHTPERKHFIPFVSSPPLCWMSWNLNLFAPIDAGSYWINLKNKFSPLSQLRIVWLCHASPLLLFFFFANKYYNSRFSFYFSSSSRIFLLLLSFIVVPRLK